LQAVSGIFRIISAMVIIASLLAVVRHWRVLLLFWAALPLVSCLQPLDSDFVGEGPGLEDDQMLWIQSVPNGEELLSYMIMVQDSEKIMQRQNAMFVSAIPDLIEDVLSGKVPAYATYGDLNPVENLREKLRQFGGSKINYAPLKQRLEISSVVQINEPDYIAKPVFLSLVWHDKGNTQNDRAFAGVYIDSLPIDRYMVKTEKGTIPLRQYLGSEWFDYDPIYVRTNDLEYTPSSRPEAIYLREQVKRGGWRRLEWLEGTINISGKKRIQLQPERMLRFAGSYTVVSQKDGQTQEIFFSPGTDHLLVDWEERFALERIFPFHATSFFSADGDVYVFETTAESTQLYLVTAGDTLIGTRFDR
jgi:hypothetical protein